MFLLGMLEEKIKEVNKLAIIMTATQSIKPHILYLQILQVQNCNFVNELMIQYHGVIILPCVMQTWNRGRD